MRAHATVLAVSLLLAAPVPGDEARQLAEGGASATHFVPIVLSAGGAQGSRYTSELVLTNRGASAATVELLYTAAIGEGSGSATTGLPPGEQRRVTDAIVYLRSLGIPIPPEGDAGGTLRVTFRGLTNPSDGFVTVRTTTPVPDGRAGLAYAGIDVLALPGPRPLPSSATVASATYTATNHSGLDAFPPPAPEATGSSRLAVFEGLDPNGTWSLWVVDDLPGTSGSLSGGWCLELTTTARTWQGCNAASIKIPETGSGDAKGAPAAPYPSSIEVADVAGTVRKAVVVLKGLTHSNAADVDVLLTGPAGRQATVLSDAGWSASSVELRLDDSWVGLLIGGLQQTSADRSNVAIMNAGAPGDGDVVVRVTVLSGDPAAPKKTTLPDETLSPGGFKQISSVLETLGVPSGWARVERILGSAPIYSYGVVNDMGNSDGSFVPPVLESEGSGVRDTTLPVVVESGIFSSELVLTNTTTATRSPSFELVADSITTADHKASFTVSLKAGEQKVIPNLVQYLRDQKVPGIPPAGTSVAGALFASLYPDFRGLLVGARTSAPGSKGRYGLFYTAVPTNEAFSAGSWLYGLLQDEETRTNLALVSTSTSSSGADSFKVELFDARTGSPAGTVEGISLSARRWVQIPMILTQGTAGLERAYARVTRTSGSGSYFAYAVLNDGAGPAQRSGDGAFVWAQPDCAYTVPAARAFGWSGGSTTVSVTATPGCCWSASAESPWIALSGEATGTGNGSVSYSVATNDAAVRRDGAISIAGKAFAVNQVGNAPGPYDGSWTGTTGQGRPISFEIERNELTRLTLGLSATIASCRAEGTFGVDPSPRPGIASDSFSESLLIPGSGGAVSVALSGSFGSSRSASGRFEISSIVVSSGGGSVTCTSHPPPGWTWTASRP